MLELIQSSLCRESRVHLLQQQVPQTFEAVQRPAQQLYLPRSKDGLQAERLRRQVSPPADVAWEPHRQHLNPATFIANLHQGDHLS